MINEYELNYLLEANIVLKEYFNGSYYIGGITDSKACLYKEANTNKWVVLKTKYRFVIYIEYKDTLEEAVDTLVSLLSYTDTQCNTINGKIKSNIKTLRRDK